MEKKELKDYSVKELSDELEKRHECQSVYVYPHQDTEFRINGPATVHILPGGSQVHLL